MNKEIWLGSSPSFLGGADTEILNMIYLWRKYDVDVNIVPMFGISDHIKKHLIDIGCKVHTYHPSIFKNKIVASWCNGNFLKELPKIMKQGRPRQVVWANCMTYVFPEERVAHDRGWIDKFIFVSKYQQNILKAQLEKINPVIPLEGYQPYFELENNIQNLKFSYNQPDKYFGVGRVSRDDGAKYSSDMWKIFDKVCSPKPKKVFVLGYGNNAAKKTGKPPIGLDWMTWSPGSIQVSDFYNRIHAMIHKTGGSRESYSRILIEAYATGVPAIVENDYAYPDLVIDGETGFLCNSSDEMSYRASQLAFDENLRKDILHNAFEFLKNKIINEEKCWAPWEKLFNEPMVSRLPAVIEDDFDMEKEKRRLQQGGCCGPTSL